MKSLFIVKMFNYFMGEIQQKKKELVEICRLVYKHELVKLGEGNISLRVSDKNEMIITPTENDYENLKIEDMVHIGFNGENFDAPKSPTSEYILHRNIYQERQKVNCILHTHSPYSSILAVLHHDLPVLFEEMTLFLGGGVKCSEYAPAGTEQLPVNALKAMKKQNAVILANHGVLVVGRSSEYCVKAAVIIEKMAKIYVYAKKIGEVKIISKENQEKFIKIFNEKYSTI